MVLFAGARVACETGICDWRELVSVIQPSSWCVPVKKILIPFIYYCYSTCEVQKAIYGYLYWYYIHMLKHD